LSGIADQLICGLVSAPSHVLAEGITPFAANDERGHDFWRELVHEAPLS
jgi:hypothetical protein